jgi:Flp pilus assembly protein TadD
MEPFVYRLPTRKFDIGLLPPNARRPGSDEFKSAVMLYFASQYAAKGETALVAVDDDEITVVALKAGQDPFQFILAMLQSGRIKEAVPLLESLDRARPRDIDVLYNLGIAYSELGQFDEAVIRLKQAVHVNPSHVHSWVGIGVAYQRMRQPAQAAEALRKAVALNPDDGYAQRNLGANLCGQGKFEEALPHLRRALEQLPHDPQSMYGYAQALEELGGEDRLGQADQLYREVIQRFSTAPIAELARTARTRIAQRNMRACAPEEVRPDVMMYIAGALDTFKQQGPERRQAIAFEIAMLGRSGLDINDPDQKYALKTLPGKFSGLHLLAIMYAGFRQIDPSVDAGVDFSKEYAMAEALQRQA